jgi:phosphoserine phosphatase
MPPWTYRLVTFDLDGTLTQGHGWEAIARAAGRLPEFHENNRRFLAHQTTEDEHLTELVDLAVGMEVDRLYELLAARHHVAGISRTIAALHERGARAALLTHNPAFVCDWYVEAFGFDDAAGTGGTEIRDGRVAAPGPIRADKPAGLATLLHRNDVPAGEAAHVGDGWADARVFPLVAAGIAFNSLFPEVDRAADVALHGDDLSDVVIALDRLLPRSV